MTAPLPLRALPALVEAWRHEVAAERLRALREAGRQVRDALLDEGPASALASCPLVTLPYPTLLAFGGGALTPAPYVMVTHRMHVVQFEDWEGVTRTLLFNPTDHARALTTPFYANLAERFGRLVSRQVLRFGRRGTVESALESLGLSPGDVDYLAFDHLHLQDLRRWLGGDGEEGAFFPRAKLLVHRAEWALARDLHPLQQIWYPPQGVSGVPDSRVVPLESDAWLGRGVALLRTPGLTLGNLSLAVVTDAGPFVVSGNGIATESWTPLQSAIPGLRAYAEQYGLEVLLRGNNRDSSLDQYSSMVLEKTVAGPSKTDPAFVGCLPSVELTASLVAPLVSPGFSHGDVSHAEVRPVAGARVSERRAS